jgi:GNAT superfamily N-acetyltransferase
MEPAPEMHIRPVTSDDAELLFGLIGELANYERLAEAVKGDAELLAKTLFDEGGAEALIAEVGEEAVGFAVFFATFSTFECRPGLWIEDIFVRVDHRRRGIGGALLAHIAGIAIECGCARLEWSALDWNEPTLRFYNKVGATRMEQWRILRLEGEELENLGGSRG